MNNFENKAMKIRKKNFEITDAVQTNDGDRITKIPK